MRRPRAWRVLLTTQQRPPFAEIGDGKLDLTFGAPVLAPLFPARLLGGIQMRAQFGFLRTRLYAAAGAAF